MASRSHNATVGPAGQTEAKNLSTPGVSETCGPPFDPQSSKAYGALCEGVHIAGYSFERALQNLKFLLQQDRWQSVGTGFDDVNKFVASIRLDNLKMVAEQRKEIAKLIKDKQPEVSNRTIAKTLGVAHTTVDRDTGTNVPTDGKKASKVSTREASPGTNVPAIGGAAAAKLIARREDGTAAKQEARILREAELADKQKALPDRRYGVILADPEWRFEPWSRETGMTYAADNHYPTSPVDVIKARDVASIAADDCALFLWATVPMLPQAQEVMTAWGFTYRTSWVWVKDRAGTGYWNRNQHELLLLGVRGDVPAPALGTQWSSVIQAPRGEHSAKPEVALEMIESYFPNLPKIELNRRGPARPGWDAWGNEAEDAA